MKFLLPNHKRLTSIRLKTMLTGFIFLTVSSTALIVYVPWLLTSQRNINEIVSQVDEEIARSISYDFGNSFKNVVVTQDLIKNVINQELVNLYDPIQRDRFFLSILQSNPNFSFVQFAYPNGDYVGAQRIINSITGQQSLKLHFREWLPHQELAIKTTDHYEIKNGKLIFIETTKIEEPQWYALNRPWYQDALKTPNQPAWTVYVYRSTNTPGLDSNITLYKEEQLIGIIGVGFELKQISKNLKQEQASREKISIFVINSKGDLIASNDPKEDNPIQVKGQDTPQLKQLRQSENRYFKLASETFEKQLLDLKSLKTTHKYTVINPEDKQKYYISLTPINKLDWMVGTVIPESKYQQRINQNNQVLFVFISVFIMGTLYIAMITSQTIFIKPINRIKEVAYQVEQGNLNVSKLPHQTCQELEILSQGIYNMVTGLRERERERDIFGRVVSPEVREKLLQGQLSLGGELCWVSVLFSDIRGFSTLAEQMSPQEVVAFLNEYLTEMAIAIRPWGGYINNFIGDAIVAIFGAPLSQANTEWCAVGAALSMRDRLEKLNQRRIERGETPINSGIGISTGEVVAGQIGSIERLLYTVIGDAVNVASRLETLTKEYPSYSILINEQTALALQDDPEILLKNLGQIKVKGRQQSVEVYAVLNEQPLENFCQVSLIGEGRRYETGGRREKI